MRTEDDEIRPATIQDRVEHAQRLIALYLEPGTSLSEELLAERRSAAKIEQPEEA